MRRQLALTCLLSLYLGTYSQSQEQSGYHLPTPAIGWERFSSNIKYPDLAHRAGITGSVMLSVLVDSTGSVDSVAPRWFTAEILVGVAVTAVETQAWCPGTQDGRATSMWFDLPIVFSLYPLPAAHPLLVTRESFQFKQQARRDSTLVSYLREPPPFIFQLIIDGAPVQIDSSMQFGLKGQGVPMHPSDLHGCKASYTQLPDSFSAWLSFGNSTLEFGPIYQAFVKYGGDLTFVIERRPAYVSEYVGEHKKEALADSTIRTHLDPAMWEGVVGIVELRVVPRVLGDGPEEVFREYEYSDHRQ